MENLANSDIGVFAFAIPLLIYWLWFIYSLEKFRLRNGKRKGVLRSELRKIRVQATIFALAFPTYLWLTGWISSIISGTQSPTGEMFLFMIKVCGGPLWLSQMLVIWSFISGFQVFTTDD